MAAPRPLPSAQLRNKTTIENPQACGGDRKRRIDWGNLKPEDVSPAPIPDLFQGDSIRIQGRFAAAGNHTVKVTGLVNGRPAVLPLQIDLPAENTGPSRKAIPLVEPFFTTRRESGGTGLGLRIVRSLLSAQGGSIRFVPGDRGGATFVLPAPMHTNRPGVSG